MRPTASVMVVVLHVALLAGEALAADRWVYRHGIDLSNDCSTAASPCKTVEHAMAVAASGDTINVAKGSYKVRVELQSSTTLTLLGGWDPTFTTRDPAASPTTLKARTAAVLTQSGWMRDKRVVVAIAEAGESITLVIDGFV